MKTKIIKALKITGVVILILLLALIAIPYFFKDQIKAKITAVINENIDATVAFNDADLSLFKNFPSANVAITQLSIINKAPFAGDTLVYFDELNLKMSIRELFKGEKEAMSIDAIDTKNGLINVIFNKDGIGNFDIALKKEEEKSEEKGKPLALNIKEYRIENYQIRYTDQASKIKMVIDSLNHTGKGDFAASKLDLATKTEARISLDMDKVNFMNKIKLNLEAVLALDLEKSKYTFKQNKALINQMPLAFDGFIQMAENVQVYDLKFKTPTSSFQNFLGLIPSAYSGSLKDVKTTGGFAINGFAKGILTEMTIPKFSIAIVSNNASFQFPSLPKAVQNISIDTKIINETGNLNDTYVNLDKLSFRIEQDVFEAKANIKNISVNPIIDAALKGRINLANLSKAYPVKLDKPLTGILNANVTTHFDMKSVETSQYQNIKNAGTISLSSFKYTDEKGKAFNISEAAIAFNPNQVHLKKFAATTGKTDLNVSGKLDNFYGFMFKKQELKGNFNLQSNQFAVADFMTAEAPTAAETKKSEAKLQEAVKIPSFLNCSLTAKINTVLYDNLALKNVSGKVVIFDQKISLENIKTDLFGGQITANGDVSTKTKTPKYHMSLGMNQVDIQQTFTQLEMMKKIAPIAGVINGRFNTTITLSGNLNEKEMTPDLNTLSGDLFGQLQGAKINPSQSALLTALGSNLKFIDFNKLNLNEVKANLTFKEGKVNIKPFDIKYQDLKVNVGGTHGFDQVMNYDLKFEVPAKYLGTEANQFIAKLTPNEAKKLENIPVNATVTGNFKNPKVSTDMKQALTNLTKQLAKQQKDKLIDKGVNELGKLLGGKKKNEADTTKNETSKPKEELKKTAGKLLNGLFKK